MIFEIDLLSKSDLNNVHNHLKNAEYLQYKNKYIVKKPSKVDEQINHLVLNCLNANEQVNCLSIKHVSSLNTLKYDVNMDYEWHVDEVMIYGIITDYSISCFLTDDYDGGELVINHDGNNVNYKLPAGKALIYPTGVLHKVNPVNSGKRIVVVGWMESLIRNSFIRDHLTNYTMLVSQLVKENNNETVLKLEQLRINLLREYANF
jgi:PKHD-type hydroxylase